MNKIKDKDKIKGMIVGVMIGDALGFPFEFKFKDLSEFDGKIKYETEHQSRFGGKKIYSVGQITDDTEMTLALFTSLIETNLIYNKNNTIMKYFSFSNTCPMMGKNTRKMLKGIKTIKGYERRIEKMQQEELENAKGNGCLMRASPLIFCSEPEIIEDCSITNINTVSKDATISYVMILKCILNNEDNFSDKMKEKFKNKQINEEVYKIVAGSKKHHMEGKFEIDMTKNKGYVLVALYLACHIYYKLIDKTITSYDQGIEYAIKFGGDTDTNGAICGAILGVWFGFNKMIKSEKTMDNYKKIMECPYDKNHVPIIKPCDFIKQYFD